MAVRLFVGNLSYTTTEADLRTYFGGIAPPSQVVLPVDRETGRPRGFAFVEYQDRAHAERAIQQFNGQVFNGRPLAVSEARAREDRGPGGPPSGPRPGGGFGPRPPSCFFPMLGGGFWRPPTTVRSKRRSCAAAQPELRTGRQTSTWRECESEKEGIRPPTWTDSAQEHRPLIYTR